MIAGGPLGALAGMALGWIFDESLNSGQDDGAYNNREYDNDTMRQRQARQQYEGQRNSFLFSMLALSDQGLQKALFVSPVVNMERLILDMMGWAGVTEAELRERREIATSFGETLSYPYLTYVREHPIHWAIPTQILYAGRDTLTSRQTVERFAKEHNAALSVMENGEHWFHTNEQLAFLYSWVEGKNM